jgi:hypothetical protein
MREGEGDGDGDGDGDGRMHVLSFVSFPSHGI